MTPKQLRDFANRPWEMDGLCPVCDARLVTRDKPFNTADSDINVHVCNLFNDGTVVCVTGIVATRVVN